MLDSPAGEHRRGFECECEATLRGKCTDGCTQRSVVDIEHDQDEVGRDVRLDASDQFGQPRGGCPDFRVDSSRPPRGGQAVPRRFLNQGSARLPHGPRDRASRAARSTPPARGPPATADMQEKTRSSQGIIRHTSPGFFARFVLGIWKIAQGEGTNGKSNGASVHTRSTLK